MVTLPVILFWRTQFWGLFIALAAFLEACSCLPTCGWNFLNFRMNNLQVNCGFLGVLFNLPDYGPDLFSSFLFIVKITLKFQENTVIREILHFLHVWGCFCFDCSEQEWFAWQKRNVIAIEHEVGLISVAIKVFSKYLERIPIKTTNLNVNKHFA